MHKWLIYWEIVSRVIDYSIDCAELRSCCNQINQSYVTAKRSGSTTSLTSRSSTRSSPPSSLSVATVDREVLDLQARLTFPSHIPVSIPSVLPPPCSLYLLPAPSSFLLPAPFSFLPASCYLLPATCSLLFPAPCFLLPPLSYLFPAPSSLFSPASKGQGLSHWRYSYTVIHQHTKLINSHFIRYTILHRLKCSSNVNRLWPSIVKLH